MFEKISRLISTKVTQEKTDTPKKIDISTLEPNYTVQFKNFLKHQNNTMNG